MNPDRRSCIRYKVQGPVYASFDGVTGGVVLDLSERGMAMQTASALRAHGQVQLGMNLSDCDYLETTGYVAWADALGRAGVRFSELPPEARTRLEQWLAENAGSPSCRAPKVTLSQAASRLQESNFIGDFARQPWAITFEPEMYGGGVKHGQAGQTVEYEFRPLGSDVPAMLRLISERARSLTRGTGAVIALGRKGSFLCQASVGPNSPPLGARLDVNSGFSGECVRTGRALRCDDAETDPRVDLASCRRLGVRSIVAAPIQYEREIVGLLEVFATRVYAFEESDVTLIERLAQTVLVTVSRMQAL